MDSAEDCDPTHTAVSNWGQVVPVCKCTSQHVLLTQPDGQHQRLEELAAGFVAQQISLIKQETVVVACESLKGCL